MSKDKRPPYHRRITRPVPRPDLPPAEGSSPELTALDQDEVLTLMVCPCCDGERMVTPAKHAELRAMLERKESA